MPVSGRASRAPVLLIGPGCSCAGPALRAASLPVHVVADPEFDSVRRYPPGWRAMRDVPLHEADAEQVAWLHAQNLATLAGKVYEPGRRTVTAIDLAEALETWDADRDAHGLSGGGTPDKHGVAPPPGRSISRLGLALELACARDETSYACLVCGSRGGQVTLPALWRLGCKLPAVVINGGCAREEVAWTWPAGCRVVMLTGGRDIFNEYKTHTGETNDEARRRRPAPAQQHAPRGRTITHGGRQAYLRSLWAAVPPASRPMAAIVHVPSMGHVPPPDFLAAILPELVAFATYGTRCARYARDECSAPRAHCTPRRTPCGTGRRAATVSTASS